MSADDQPVRLGRKTLLPPEQRKRETFTFRVRSELRNKMEEAASLNGRSLSEEIEFRLEMSFMFENIASKKFLDEMAQTIAISNMKDRQIESLKEVGKLAIRVHKEAVNALQRNTNVCVDFANRWKNTQSNPEMISSIDDLVDIVNEGLEAVSRIDFSKVEGVFDIKIE